MAAITWNGSAIRDRIAAASAEAIDVTMAECVGSAREAHPRYPPASKPFERYANRTEGPADDGGDGPGLTNTITVLKPAKPDLHGKVSGTWGSVNPHALYLEIGTSVTGPTATEREEAGGGDIDAVPPPIGPLMAPRPYLRPATDFHYPTLGLKIRAFLSGRR